MRASGSAAVDGVGVGARAVNTPTVVICDDEQRLARLTAGLLEQLGYRAVSVSGRKELLDWLDRGEQRVDVVLLDVNLGVGKPEDVIEVLRARGIGATFVLTSGYAREDVSPSLLSTPSVAAYLAKPYTVEQLAHAIEMGMAAKPQPPSAS